MSDANEPKEGFIVTQGRLIRDLVPVLDRSNLGYMQVGSPAMPETKIRKFLKQFTWVSPNFVPQEHISQVYVSGVDPQMIDRMLEVGKPYFIEEDGYRECAFLLDENGQVVTRQVEVVKTWKKYFLFGPVCTKKHPVTFDGRVRSWGTIRSALNNLGDQVDRVRFILSYDAWTKVVIVYKRPTGAGFWEWVRDEIPEPAAEVV